MLGYGSDTSSDDPTGTPPASSDTVAAASTATLLDSHESTQLAALDSVARSEESDDHGEPQTISRKNIVFKLIGHDIYVTDKDSQRYGEEGSGLHVALPVCVSHGGQLILTGDVILEKAINVHDSGIATVSGSVLSRGLVTVGYSGRLGVEGDYVFLKSIRAHDSGVLDVLGSAIFKSTIEVEYRGQWLLAGNMLASGRVTVKDGGFLQVSGNMHSTGEVDVSFGGKMSISQNAPWKGPVIS